MNNIFDENALIERNFYLENELIKSRTVAPADLLEEPLAFIVLEVESNAILGVFLNEEDANQVSAKSDFPSKVESWTLQTQIEADPWEGKVSNEPPAVPLKKGQRIEFRFNGRFYSGRIESSDDDASMGVDKILYAVNINNLTLPSGEHILISHQDIVRIVHD